MLVRRLQAYQSDGLGLTWRFEDFCNAKTQYGPKDPGELEPALSVELLCLEIAADAPRLQRMDLNKNPGGDLAEKVAKLARASTQQQSRQQGGRAYRAGGCT